jgi:hypothetical protein
MIVVRLRWIALAWVSAGTGLVWCAQVEGEPTNGTLIFKADYEDKRVIDAAPGVSANMPAAADALQVSCDIARAGQCALVARVLPLPEYVSAEAYRAESDAMAMLSARYSAGESFVYRFSLWVPPDWFFDSTKSIDIVWQFKRFSSPPDMVFAIKGQALVLRIGKSAQLTAMPNMPRGQWVDVQLQVHWAANSEGRVGGTVRPAIGGNVVPLNYAGPTMLNAKPQAGYLKWGLYKPGKTDGTLSFPPRQVRLDEIYVYRLK